MEHRSNRGAQESIECYYVKYITGTRYGSGSEGDGWIISGKCQQRNECSGYGKTTTVRTYQLYKKSKLQR